MKSVTAEYAAAFEGDTMQVLPKVVIQFGDNRYNEPQTTTASSTKSLRYGITDPFFSPTIPFWTADEAFNNRQRNTMRWGLCDQGATCDSGYRAVNINDAKQFLDPISVIDSVYSHGWWSAANDSSPWVQSVFQTARPINQIDVWLTEGYNIMTSVTVSYLSNGSWTSMPTTTCTTGVYHYQIPLSQTVQCSGLKVAVNRGSETYARIQQLQGLLIVDVSSDVVKFDLSETREQFDGTVPAANIKSKTLDLTLDNSLQHYTPDNFSSPYFPYIEHDNKITVSLGILTTSGEEYQQMGVFYTDQWDASGAEVTCTVKCRDFSKYLQDVPVDYGHYWLAQDGATIGSILKDLMVRAGKDVSEMNIDTSASRQIPLVYVHNVSFWNFLGELTFADQGMFGFDAFDNFYYKTDTTMNNPNSSSLYTFAGNKNIIDAESQSQLFLNSVIVNVAGINIGDVTIKSVWEPPITSGESSLILTWANLGGSIGATDTDILLDRNLDNALWDPSGYLVIDNELISFISRDSYTLHGCIRGIGGTVAASHSQGTYVGGAEYWPNIQFSTIPLLLCNPVLNEFPTLDINGKPIWQQTQAQAPYTRLLHVGDAGYPFVTAIDGLKQQHYGQPQAQIVIWRADAFGGYLAIANTVPFNTPLIGSTGLPIYSNQNIVYGGDWITRVSGAVPQENANRSRLNKSPVANLNNLRLVRKHGKTQITISNQWIQTQQHANDLANILLNNYNTPRSVLQMNAIANPALDLGDRVTVSNYQELGLAALDYNIINISYTYDGGLIANYTLREVLAADYALQP